MQSLAGTTWLQDMVSAHDCCSQSSGRATEACLNIFKQVEGEDVPQRLPAIIHIVQLALLHTATNHSMLNVVSL